MTQVRDLQNTRHRVADAREPTPLGLQQRGQFQPPVQKIPNLYAGGIPEAPQRKHGFRLGKPDYAVAVFAAEGE